MPSRYALSFFARRFVPARAYPEKYTPAIITGSNPKGYTMPKSLQRPVVLLTGASSGIGYDVAPLLVRYGYTV